MENITLLQKIHLFKHLSAKELIELNKIVRRSACKAGARIVEEGAASDALFIVKSGSVTVTKSGRLIAHVGASEMIGEISFLDHGPRSATVTAAEDAVLIRIPTAALEKLMASNPSMAAGIYQKIAVSLCARLRETDEALLLD